MATWVVHMRVAEIILGKYDIGKAAFLAGNIGPDCGVPDETWFGFTPSKTVTHWMIGDERNGENIHDEAFYSEYIKGYSNIDLRDSRYAFLLGYYAHLLTDMEWSKMIHLQISRDTDFGCRFREDPEFIWEVKRDWYGLDFKYLADNPGNIFETLFNRIDSMPEYLDYFPEGALMRQIRYIQKFYGTKNDWVNNEFKYLTENEMNDFVGNTGAKILKRFDQILHGFGCIA